MKQWKKLLAAVLVVAMVLPGITLVAPQVEEVQAADVTATGKEVTEQNGTLFAGYYVDNTYEIPSNVEGGVEKWVDSGVLNVKMQLRKGSAEGTYDLRLVSSVDTLNYKNVGYRISFDANNDKNFAKEEVTTWTSKEVAKRIDATTSTFAYNYSPKVIDTKSEYFITGIMEGIKEEHKDKDFLIEPFWTTMDGTKVFGQSRWFSISDMLLGKININLPVQMAESDYNAVGTSINVGTTAATVSESYYDGRYAHFNLTVTDKTTLPSASVVTVGNEKVIYRNLESKGPTGDTTWYEKYVEVNPSETEFVIATSADLYGLEAVQSLEGNVGMAGKKVYMVADIALNDVTGITDWSTFGPSVAASKSFASWTPIGRYTGFAGTFDGQMHTISGLYTNPGFFGVGLFGCIKTGSVIKNLYLKDSWMQGTNRIGGIVGISDGGTIDTVYNGAYVISTTGLKVSELTNQGVGGIVGLVRNGATDIKNCWNAGTVFSSHASWAFAGGIVGNSNNSVTVVNCLNSGIVRSDASLLNIYMGGIVGGGYSSNTSYNIKYCLSTGEIRRNSVSTGCIGSFCGKADNGGKATVSHSYSTTIALGTSTEESLYGSSGWATTLLNDDYWVAVEEGVPELKSFRSMSDKNVSDVSSVIRTDTSWYDSNPTAEEYTLYTEEEFNGLIEITGKLRTPAGASERERQNFTNRTIKLGADLVFNEGDAKEWKNSAPGRNSKSVGAVSGVTYDSEGIHGCFDGTFDGQEYTISGLYMNRGTENYAGLFGIIGDNAVIKDFKLLNSYITGNGQSGTIVGRSNGGTISSVYSDAIFASADARTGGIVGSCWANKTDLTNCCFAGEMILTSGGQPLAGGIVGENVNTTVIVDGCWFDGKITSTSSAYAQKLGGIFGRPDGSSGVAIQTEIKNCLSTGRITSNSPNHSHEGSIAGYVGGNVTSISDSYGSDTTQAYTYWTSEAITTGTLPEEQLNGAAGMVYTTLAYTAWVGVKAGTPQLKSFQTRVTADYDVATDRVDTSWYTSDESGETYMLENAGDYFGFVQLSRNNKDFEGQKIQLNADLDLKDIWCQSISPINSPFKGTFEGNNNTISGLHIVSDEQHLGMFGYVGAMGKVQNVTLEDSYIESNYADENENFQVVASIAGRLAGKLANVDSSADVVCNQNWAGGLVAQTFHDTTNYPLDSYPNLNPTLNQCSYTGTLTMTNSNNQIAGGIVGQVQGTTNIDNCLFAGVIDSYDVLYNERTGGIVGYVANTLTLSNCLSSGKIQFSKSEEITAAGSVIGYVTGNNANNYVTLLGVVYATADCFQSADGDILFWSSDTNTITGADTYMKEFTSTLNSTIGELNTTYWQEVEGGTPILK